MTDRESYRWDDYRCDALPFRFDAGAWARNGEVIYQKAKEHVLVTLLNQTSDFSCNIKLVNSLSVDPPEQQMWRTVETITAKGYSGCQGNPSLSTFQRISMSGCARWLNRVNAP